MFADLRAKGLEGLPKRLEVVKKLPDGQVRFRYWGDLIGANPEERLLSATFTFDHQLQNGYWFRTGDLSLEWFSAKESYNILELHEGQSDLVKFWYCNLCSPAEFQGEQIYWTDFALDLIVNPRGEFFLLDQDQLALQDLSWDEYVSVWRNLDKLMNRFKQFLAR